jgi:hypothetical protein
MQQIMLNLSDPGQGCRTYNWLIHLIKFAGDGRLMVSKKENWHTMHDSLDLSAHSTAQLSSEHW